MIFTNYVIFRGALNYYPSTYHSPWDKQVISAPVLS